MREQAGFDAVWYSDGEGIYLVLLQPITFKMYLILRLVLSNPVVSGSTDLSLPRVAKEEERPHL